MKELINIIVQKTGISEENAAAGCASDAWFLESQIADTLAASGFIP
jgi:hypothetical protein